jgi:hypothetical protein
MYIRDAHILVEQGLQNIGVFAYADIQHDEIDIQLNKKMLNLMEDAFDPLKKSKHPYQDGQSIVDKFQNLQNKNYNLTGTLSSDGTMLVAPLPVDYVHLIADASLVLKVDNMTPINSGAILPTEFYYNAGQKTIIYNSVSYPTGTYFNGVNNITGYTTSGSGSVLVVKLRQFINPNRLQFEEFTYQVLTNWLTKTNYKAPVSSVSGNNLYGYIKKDSPNAFIINNFFITYIRKPKKANYFFKTYGTSDPLTVGQSYESVDNPVIYNGQTYQPFQPFSVVTGITSYSNLAKVRLQGDGDIEFSDTMAYDVIDEVIKEISILTEQNQQKIVNLIQKEQ